MYKLLVDVRRAASLSVSNTPSDHGRFIHCELVTNPQLAELNVAPAGFSPLFFFAATPQAFCHQDQGWITQYKAFAAYTLPRVDVQLSGGYQGLPGLLIASNYNAPLGIPFKVVQIVEPGSGYGDRMNQFDFRISKLFTAGRFRMRGDMNIYNAFNSAFTPTVNTTFSTASTSQYLRATTVLQGRVIKFGGQIDF